MTTSSHPLPRAGVVRPKHVLFAAIFLMLAYVLQHNERFLVNAGDPIWSHYEPFKWWLLPHGLAGACALLLGPMQFSDRLRRRFTRLHRVVGRVYVFGALVAAPLGVYIQYFEERLGAHRSFTIASAVDAALLMVTTGIAFLCIRRGRVQQHRQWMTRSYAVALVFAEVRLVSGVFHLDDQGDAVGELIVWCCVAFSLLLADVLLQLQEFARERAAVRPAPAAGPA